MVVKDGSRVLMTVAAVVVVGAGLSLARPVLAPVLAAGFVAAITAPLVLFLLRRGVPGALAVATGLLVDFLALAGIGLVLGNAIADLSAERALYVSRVVELFDGFAAWAARHGADVDVTSLRSWARPDAMMDAFGTVLRRILGLLSQLFLILLLIAFMLAELTDWSSKVKTLVRDREDLVAIRVAAKDVRGFLRVKAATSAATGVLAFAICAALGIELPVLWGLLTFMLNFIPNVGSIIAAIPPIVMGLLLQGPGTAALVAGGYLLINTVIGTIVEPRIMGNTLGLSPLVVFLGMLLWGWLLGPIGALLSPPLTVFLKSWLEHTCDLRWVAVLLGSGNGTRRAGGAPPEEGGASPGE